jgi:hypothetical protein
METQATYQQSLFDTTCSGYVVKPIKSQETHWFLLEIHYAKRLPSISHAFGLFLNDELVGVVTYGSPASNTLCSGLCGVEYKKHVLELNRLVLKNNLKNEASRLVGGSLKLLPKPRIIVSFADNAQHHTGYIYQATNFIYTGLSAKRNEWAVEGLEHLHSKTLSDGRSIEEIKAQYGDKFYYRERSRKHRYVTFTGNKQQRAEMRNALKYEVLPYPKAEKGKHEPNN